ncbi:MAG: sigma-70 family RNA polymerase sigma factor [Spirochaetes bacterium]|nr:sigma-70 family RNA polymerase sigma factor [Spirochaetota bacterium]MBU0956968.1 sigma-70 family RNA polymerase sigma factor [Spirochaetota bacterium]
MNEAEPELSDAEVIARVLDGETDAFALLVRRHQRRILRLGYGFFRNSHEAEDFVQDVFLKAWAGLSGFRGKAAFSTWLTRIAYNTGINAKRVSGRYEALDYEPEDDRSLSPEDAHLRKEAGRILRSAMAALPEKYAVCLDLFFFEGLPYAEISQITGYPVNTIKSHVFRAKQELRTSLAPALALPSGALSGGGIE